jgi:hypothetical protein
MWFSTLIRPVCDRSCVTSVNGGRVAQPLTSPLAPKTSEVMHASGTRSQSSAFSAFGPDETIGVALLENPDPVAELHRTLLEALAAVGISLDLPRFSGRVSDRT